ncbi:MAG: hypothetical protein BGO21_12360 [Dyadobacter sp. 50-39]|uniref:hypothetical protein n=1 Tax=Dyadobacter sp. 50-39 TaxID=1895756 RepID=UPI000964E3DB|nr:hypothetical protein [Dyadobacter sp. 50-39]OJV20166.1 MAG: hypothetical protein BGO21_12360 [Dyadobacter sp. 50-39]
MAASHTVPTRLSNLQSELLKLYAYNVSDAQLKDIRKMLADYFAGKIDAEMDQLWEANNWDDTTIESWKSEHMRSKSSQ